jgi:tetratricopeptide (TPR) repeat protein
MRIVPSAMIGSIALATVLSTLAALGAFYASQSEWPYGIAAGRGTTAAANLAVEDWPICSSVSASGPEADWAEIDPDLAAGKKALAKGAWTDAITALEFAMVRNPGNADIHAYIGYAYGRLSQFGPAMGQFQQALSLNPRHRAAHEHLGELFLALQEPAAAEEHLAALKQICLIPCQEVGNLQREIRADSSSSKR